MTVTCNVRGGRLARCSVAEDSRGVVVSVVLAEVDLRSVDKNRLRDALEVLADVLSDRWGGSNLAPAHMVRKGGR